MNRKNILLIGGPNDLTNRLIRQFQKEGHRVSLLTGLQHFEEKYPRVFERYDFSYTSEVLPEVFNSVSPDVTVFTGAYDSNFSWRDERGDSVAYVSSVMNLLNAYSTLGKGRFVYLSSEDVFQAEGQLLYKEDDVPNAVGPRGAALVQAEDICRRFMMDACSDIVIARLGGVYHLPETPGDVDDSLSQLCIEYLRDGAVNIPDEQLMMPLAQSDAVFFLSRLALAEEHRDDCYHIASGTTISAVELMEVIAAAAAARGYVIPDGTEKPEIKHIGALTAALQRHIERREDLDPDKELTRPNRARNVRLQNAQAMLDAERFRDEFGINRLSPLEPELQRIVAHLLKNKDSFLTPGSEEITFLRLMRKEFGWLGKALLPVLENLACFVVAFLLSDSAAGGKYFSRIDFYLLYVLLFAILYGQHQAIFSAVLATVGFLFSQLRSSSGTGMLLDYSTYVWIAQLLILGLSVGYLRDRLTTQKEESRLDHDYMEAQLDDVREINKSNLRVKDALHNQVVNQNDSIGKIYTITASLDQYNPEEVLFRAMDILRKIMGSEDIALYTVHHSEYARLFSATSTLAASLGNSVKYRELGELYEAVREGRPFINRKMEEGLPQMACAIREGEELRTIIMIWRLPWEKMTLGQSSILTVTSLLIQNAVLRANRYLQQEQRYVEGTQILREDAFASILTAYHNALEHRLTEYTLLKLWEDGETSVEELGERVQGCFRQNDYLGVGHDGALYALLPSVSEKNIGAVMDRLKEKAGDVRTEVSETANTEVTV